MGQGIQINYFWNIPAFASAIFKDGGRQYKCHNISKTTSHRTVMLMTLDSLVDSDVRHIHLTFIYIHVCANFKDGVRLSHLPIS